LTIFELAALSEHACGGGHQNSDSEDHPSLREVQASEPADRREEEEGENPRNDGEEEEVQGNLGSDA